MVLESPWVAIFIPTTPVQWRQGQTQLLPPPPQPACLATPLHIPFYFHHRRTNMRAFAAHGLPASDRTTNCPTVSWSLIRYRLEPTPMSANENTRHNADEFILRRREGRYRAAVGTVAGGRAVCGVVRGGCAPRERVTDVATGDEL